MGLEPASAHAPAPIVSRCAAGLVLRVRDLSFGYPGEPALWSRWSVDVREGATCLLGDTGSGKSTLLRLMSGAVTAAGEFTLCGVQPSDGLAAYRRRLFYVEPVNEAFEQANAHAVRALMSEGDALFSQGRWRDLVDGFALTPHLDKPSYMLSTGTKRKVWLAAGLACGRSLILLDEPTAGLDARSIECLWAALAEVSRRPGCAVVVASTERFDRLPWVDSIELPPR